MPRAAVLKHVCMSLYVQNKFRRARSMDTCSLQERANVYTRLPAEQVRRIAARAGVDIARPTGKRMLALADTPKDKKKKKDRKADVKKRKTKEEQKKNPPKRTAKRTRKKENDTRTKQEKHPQKRTATRTRRRASRTRSEVL